MSEQATGRRAAQRRERRIDVLVALGIALLAVVALAIGVIGDQEDPLVGPIPPETARLTAATVVCPEAARPQDGGPVRVTRAPATGDGDVAVRTAPPGGAELGEPSVLAVPDDGAAAVRRSGGVTVIEGEGAAAPGIVAGRSDRLAVPECRAPSYDEWLVGVGASARYSTTLELVNPDDGGAVVDIALHGADGPVEEPALRGIQVPPHSVKRIDLAEAAPRRSATAAHVTVTRGRVTLTARNTWDPLGRGRVATDFLPAHAAPATRSLILGVAQAPANASLFLANPGDDEVRATVRLVTRESVFTPAGAEEVAVPPGAMSTVDLRPLLTGPAGEGVLGLVVESTGPLAASARMLVRGDLALLAPVPELRAPAAAVLPSGRKTLLLGGAIRPGVVHVHSFDAAGRELAEQRVEVAADRAVSVRLPRAAVRVTVEARNTRISALVAMPVEGRSAGLGTLRLRPAEVRARIPAVRPQ
ncbi:DUF5719 family protein [Nocardioides sp. SYSU DS0651]|uniref:DUF5719 family protein n=1 Tax=Nocardioides sp. SYSU DS0651 TaxID=3415955 RepID=UPI003F4C4618